MPPTVDYGLAASVVYLHNHMAELPDRAIASMLYSRSQLNVYMYIERVYTGRKPTQQRTNTVEQL